MRSRDLYIASAIEPIIIKTPKAPVTIDGHEVPDSGIGITAIKGSKWSTTGDVEQDGAAREGLYILAHTNEEIQKSAPGQWVRFGLLGMNIFKGVKGKQEVAYRILVNGEVVCPETYEGNARSQYISQFYVSLSNHSHTGTWAIPKVRCAGDGSAPFWVVDYKIPKDAARLTVTAEMTDSEGNWTDLSEDCEPLVIGVGKGYGDSTVSIPTPLPGGSSQCMNGDINGDGVVNIIDIGIIIDHYGK